MSAGVGVKCFTIGVCVLAGLLSLGFAPASGAEGPAKTFADLLIAAKSQPERAALLAGRRADATPALFDDLVTRGTRLVLVDPSKAAPAFEAALAVADVLGDDGLRARAVSHIGEVAEAVAGPFE